MTDMRRHAMIKFKTNLRFYPEVCLKYCGIYETFKSNIRSPCRNLNSGISKFETKCANYAKHDGMDSDIKLHVLT
jgi:hypothetical protein